jgi:hypothetical protein
MASEIPVAKWESSRQVAEQQAESCRKQTESFERTMAGETDTAKR